MNDIYSFVKANISKKTHIIEHTSYVLHVSTTNSNHLEMFDGRY